jgi:anthranilate synthase component 1
VAYDGVQRFEDVDFQKEITIPEIHYAVYQFIIVFDHFKNEGYLIEAQIDQAAPQEFDELYDLIMRQSIPQFSFEKRSDISSDFTDEEFLEVVKKGIHHCDIGDVFQVVFSRKFEVEFKGDEFQVYRALRSINPSPYLFYFDYGDFKLFGSSPEAQIVINEKEAIIHPIAGTFKRTGDDQADAELAKKLLEDEKENSEHIMLVDLARNDLSKNTEEVTVETYKEIQYYSHVIHLVSKVTGRLAPDTDALQVMANTFPAGTLSGAPKHRALQLINQYEHSPRGYYGGAIGYIDFKGTMNQAIMIRTFMSQGNKLTFRAGAGIVAKSDPESEVKEVYNKVAALQTALKEAENID